MKVFMVEQHMHLLGLSCVRAGDALPNIDAVKLKHWKGTRTAHKLKFGKEPILAAGQVYPLAISTPSRDTEALMVGSGRIIAAEVRHGVTIVF